MAHLDSTQADKPFSCVNTEESHSLPFGLLSYAGAALSLIACYAQVILSLIAPLVGLSIDFRDDAPSVLEVNPQRAPSKP